MHNFLMQKCDSSLKMLKFEKKGVQRKFVKPHCHVFFSLKKACSVQEKSGFPIIFYPEKGKHDERIVEYF